MPQYLKYNRHLPQFKVIEKYFSEEEVEKIIDLEDLQKFTEGKVGSNKGGGIVDSKARKKEQFILLT